jgi:asparagine N-glycosylation enzyme membrane subunit Stt3
MFTRPPFLRRAPLWGLTLLALALALALSWARHQSWIVPARSHEVRPTTGAIERRASGAPLLPAVYLDADGLYWLRYARDVLSGSALRVRHAAQDNVPAGREVHWSSPLPWSLALAAKLRAPLAGVPAAGLLASTAVWLNPLFFGLFLIGTAGILSRRLGPWTAGFLVLALACLPPVHKDFSAARIDHHGLVDVFSLWMPLLLLGGLDGLRADASSARRWFVAAGVAGGLGLWLQASLQLIVVAAALAALFLRSVLAPVGAAPEEDEAARCWRAWAVAGALVSLAVYLLEYFPAHLGLRLEVNHPLYALAWWGATESSLQIRRMRRAGRFSTRRVAVLLAGLLPALLTAGLIARGGERFFLLSSPLLRRIHAQIGEFAPLLALFQGSARWSLLYLFGLLPFVALGGLPLLVSRRIPAPTKTGLGLAFASALLAAVLCLRHVRYASLLALALWAAAAAGLLALEAGAFSRRWKSAVLGALAVGCGLAGGVEFRQARAALEQPLAQTGLRSQIILRDVARELAGLPGFAGSRVLCGYDEAPALQAFADVATTGGLYWENLAGLRAATLVFSATDDAEARRVLAERGMGWIVLNGTPRSVAAWTFNRRGAVDEAAVRASLAFRLATRSGVPSWLEQIPFDRLPLATLGSFVVYRVIPETAGPPDTAATAPR